VRNSAFLRIGVPIIGVRSSLVNVADIVAGPIDGCLIEADKQIREPEGHALW
jgi:hypothetical protein